MTSVFSKKAHVEKKEGKMCLLRRERQKLSLFVFFSVAQVREKEWTQKELGERWGTSPRDFCRQGTALGQIVKDASISMLMLVLAQLLPRYGDRLARRNATFFHHRAVCTSDPSRQEEKELITSSGLSGSVTR